MTSSITVSNGQAFRRIHLSELPDARRQGFYRPHERGLTIVGSGELLFEIPLVDLPRATRDGYRDLLADEPQERLELGTLRRPAENMDTLAPAGITVTDEPVASLNASASPRASLSASASASLGTDATRLMRELTRAEQEAELAQQARQQELEQSEGWRWYVVFLRLWIDERRLMVLDYLRGSGVSLTIHVAILLLLASLALVNEKQPDTLFISANPTSVDAIEEVVIEPTPLDITEPTEAVEADATPESEELPIEMAEAVDAPNFLANVSGDAIAAPAPPAPEPAMKKEEPNSSKVFGTARSATNYVFVIDNSNSMTRGRFETALYELMVAVNSLTPKQNFMVLFYSDTAYAMMHPNPVRKLVPATPKNKQLLAQWLNTVPLCLQTRGLEALEIGFGLQPDILYVLGDGAFTDKADKVFAAKPRSKTIVHCRGMEVDAKNAASFEALAKAHGGNYKDVGVHPFAAEYAKKNPRPRNSTRNGYWGLKLPETKKKPKS